MADAKLLAPLNDIRVNPYRRVIQEHAIVHASDVAPAKRDAGDRHALGSKRRLRGVDAFQRQNSPPEYLVDPLRRLAEADTRARGHRVAGIAAARERFYRGDIAAMIGAFSERTGGLLRAGDHSRSTGRAWLACSTSSAVTVLAILRNGAPSSDTAVNNPSAPPVDQRILHLVRHDLDTGIDNDAEMLGIEIGQRDVANLHF